MAYTKKTNTKAVNPKELEKAMTKDVVLTKEQAKTVTVQEARHYEPSDAIPCHSIVGGYVNFLGRKTGTVYSWYDNGDISNLEYQDLRAAMLSKSPYIFDPIIIIDDEELLELPEWKSVKELYESLYSVDDLTKIFDLPIGQMVSVIDRLPNTVKRSMITLAKTMVDDGRLESIKKIRALDSALGTDLLNAVTEE